MRRSKVGLVILSATVFTLVFATMVLGATVKHTFSFDIQNVTTGKNYHPYSKGSCKITASGKTINPWDGTEYFAVSLKKFANGVGTDYYLADGVTRTKTVTVPTTADFYPQVYLKRNNIGSQTRVKGTGHTTQDM